MCETMSVSIQAQIARFPHLEYSRQQFVDYALSILIELLADSIKLFFCPLVEVCLHSVIIARVLLETVRIGIR